jgi:hypothetical protein
MSTPSPPPEARRPPGPGDAYPQQGQYAEPPGGTQQGDQPQASPPPGYEAGAPAPGSAAQEYPAQSYPAGGQPPPGYPAAGAPAPYGGDPGTVAQSDPLVATSFSDWWSKVIGVLARSWQPLLIIQIATVIPGMILSALVTAAGASESRAISIGGALLGLVGGLIVFVVALLAQGASVYVVGKQASGEEVGAGPALSFAAGRALPLLGWGIVAAILVGLGFILFLLPGIYLIIVFAASLTGVIMFERSGIGRTFSLVNPAFGATFGRLLSFALAALVYYAVVGAIVGALFGRGFFAGLVANVLSLPVTFASVGVAVVTYASLRHRENPAVTTPTLAAELDRA